MINVSKVAKSFGTRVLWSDVSFVVNSGEMLALVGPSGCGKSTLLNCLGLLDTVDSGEITIADRSITNLRGGAQRRLRRDAIGFLFQNYALIESANIEFNLRIASTANPSRSQHRDALESALKAVGLGGRGREMVYRSAAANSNASRSPDSW